jgi:hypothetical protein
MTGEHSMNTDTDTDNPPDVVARFLAWDATIEGFRLVVLTTEYPEFEHSGGGPCDEGAHYWHIIYGLGTDHAGTPVVCRVSSRWGRDCDGRHSAEDREYCPVSDLAAYPVADRNTGATVNLPLWRPSPRHSETGHM